MQREAQPGDDVHALAEQGVELRQFHVRRYEHDTAFGDARDIGERLVLDEKSIDALIGMPRGHTEDMRQVALWIEVDAGGTLSA